MIPARSSAQESQPAPMPGVTGIHRSPTVPFFAEGQNKESGSLYLTKKWCRGHVVLWNQQQIPEKDEFLLFNYDKVRNLVYVMDQYAKQWTYPIDSVSSFEIVENSVIYAFEKVPWISKSYYLMPIYKSEKGYSLYKRLFTKSTRSAYGNGGFTAEGKRYDEYADTYEYYLVYPGNTSYKKVNLKESVVRRALKDDEKLVNEYFALNELEINEQSFLGIIQYINDKKYPD
jgi:hypothetical protein